MVRLVPSMSTACSEDFHFLNLWSFSSQHKFNIPVVGRYLFVTPDHQLRMDLSVKSYSTGVTFTEDVMYQPRKTGWLGTCFQKFQHQKCILMKEKKYFIQS